MSSLILIILAVLFVWLLMRAQKSHKQVGRANRRVVDKIRNRDR